MELDHFFFKLILCLQMMFFIYMYCSYNQQILEISSYNAAVNNEILKEFQSLKSKSF